MNNCQVKHTCKIQELYIVNQAESSLRQPSCAAKIKLRNPKASKRRFLNHRIRIDLFLQLKPMLERVFQFEMT
jgi:hypothetical protein